MLPVLFHNGKDKKHLFHHPHIDVRHLRCSLEINLKAAEEEFDVFKEVAEFHFACEIGMNPLSEI